jgi:hypothetical protein
MANDAAKINIVWKSAARRATRTATERGNKDLIELQKILSNFRSGAMNLLERVRSGILKVKPTCLNPQVNSSQTIRPLRQAR